MSSKLFNSNTWRGFNRGFGEGRPCLLAFDFDGTLAPLAATPSQARMDLGLRLGLKRLMGMPNVQVALLSGRGLDDLRRRVALKGAVLFSNHGLDASRRSLAPGVGKRRRWRRLARQAKSRLVPALTKGAMLEDKGLDLCLHVRGMSRVQRLRQLLAARRALAGLPLKLGPGKFSLEIRPAGPWDKGSALMKGLKGMGPDALCLFAGDDRTDEDAFVAMKHLGRRGLGLKVGLGPTQAKFRIPRRSLEAILWRLTESRRQKGGRLWN